MHAIVDHVVDGYQPVLYGIEDDIGEVEEEVFSPTGHNPVERTYYLKREVLSMIKATASLQEPLERLARLHDIEYLHDDIAHYFRDVLDHLLRVLEQVTGYNEMLTSILEANLPRVSIRQNEDMKKMAAWAAIGIVPTAMAGIYGMNFRHMPELHWRFGYPLSLLTIFVVFVHLHPQVEVKETNGSSVLCRLGRQQVLIEAFAEDGGNINVEVVSGGEAPIQGWYFSDFGIAEPSATIRFDYQIGDGKKFGYTINANHISLPILSV